MRNFRGFALVLLLAALTFAKTARAGGMFTQCNQGVPEVAVNLDYATPRENTTQTARQIDDLMRNDADSSLAADRKGIYVGVTRSKLEVKSGFTFGVDVNTVRSAACPYIKTVTYDFIYHPEVYIASDFLSMSCRYGVTSMHEQRHIHTFLMTINEFMPQIRRALNDYIPHMPPTQPVTTNEAASARTRELAQAVNASLEPLISQFRQVLRQRQAEIDTPENYAHDQAICPGALPAFPQ